MRRGDPCGSDRHGRTVAEPDEVGGAAEGNRAAGRRVRLRELFILRSRRETSMFEHRFDPLASRHRFRLELEEATEPESEAPPATGLPRGRRAHDRRPPLDALRRSPPLRRSPVRRGLGPLARPPLARGASPCAHSALVHEGIDLESGDCKRSSVPWRRTRRITARLAAIQHRPCDVELFSGARRLPALGRLKHVPGQGEAEAGRSGPGRHLIFHCAPERRSSRTGRVTVKVEPFPGALSTSSEPRSSSQ